MVDINLIGEEEKHEAPSREASFDQDIRLDSTDFASGEQRSYNTMTDLPELTQGRGNTRLFVIIGALIIVIAGVLYMLLKKEPEDEILQTLTDPDVQEKVVQKPQPIAPQPTEPVEEAAPAQTAGEETGLTAEGETIGMDQPAVELTPIEQEIAESAVLGQFVVQSVVNAISGQAIPTLIRQTGDSFMAEFVAPSDGELAGIMGQLRNELQSGNLKIVHQENYPLHGPTAVKATVTGNVAAGAIGATGGIQYFSLNDFFSWLRNTAAELGLSVKAINQSTSRDGGQYAVTPVQVTLDGDLGTILRFLGVYSQTIPNLEIEKISIINKDPRANTSDSMSLVMILQHYSG